MIIFYHVLKESVLNIIKVVIIYCIKVIGQSFMLYIICLI